MDKESSAQDMIPEKVETPAASIFVSPKIKGNPPQRLRYRTPRRLRFGLFQNVKILYFP